MESQTPYKPLSSRIGEETIRKVSKKRALLGSERGSIVIMLGFLIPILVLMAVVVADVGQLVLEKIRLQNTADACALAAVTVQSAGLNEIADLNRELHLEFVKLQTILASGIWHNVIHGINAIRFYKSVFAYIRRKQEETNQRFAQWSRDMAENTMRMNQPANRTWSLSTTTAGRLMDYATDRKIASFVYVASSCAKCPPMPTLTWLGFKAGSPTIWGPHDGRMISVRQVSSLGFYATNVTVRIIKDPRTTQAAVRLTQAPPDFILGRPLFGSMPELTATAAGKPTGGRVFAYQPEYRPLLTD